jgi:hypothetical protein
MSLVEEARAVRERIAARLRELEPLVREYEQLRQLAAEMGVTDSDPPSTASAPSTAQRRRPPSTHRSSSEPAREVGLAQEPEGDGELADRVLEAVRTEPGKTVAEYATVLRVAPAALYRPVRRLASEGALIKRARALFPG